MTNRLRKLAVNPHKGPLIRSLQPSLRARSNHGESLAPNLEAVYGWLCAAQDATPDGGVSGWFELVSGQWANSYPETTGYIIPTFLAYAEARSDPDARERALRMADWEIDVQLDDGAVLSGVLGTPPAPAVFNTGQATFGWVSSFEATGDERYAEAARRACNWLVRTQESDGSWRRSLSGLTTASVCTYNVRCAWALAYAGAVLGEPTFTETACRSCDWTLDQQTRAGWFAHTGFDDGESPLLHTISYVIEGLVGVYAFAEDERYLAASQRALDALVADYKASRKLSGRYDDGWKAPVSWRCPTGEAQVAVVLLRLADHVGEPGYRDVARHLLRDLAAMQLGGRGGSNGDDPSRGGLTGAHPIWAPYCAFSAINWAAKFFLDGLLLDLHGVDDKSFRPLPTR